MTRPNDSRQSNGDDLGPSDRTSTRRAEDAGRSLKRRPEGRGAAEGGGEGRQAPLAIPQLTLQTTATDGRRQRRRAAAKAQLLIAQQCAHLPEAGRIIQCGRTANNARGVTIKRSADGGRVYASGVVTCGSPWSCLACSYKIRSKRARAIALAIACHIALGGGVLFGTFTFSHDRGEQLDRVWDVLGKGWRHMTSGQYWVDFKDSFGLAGSIKTVEVTHGRNGWHPHIHVLFFIDAPMNDFDREDDYREFRRFLRERWITYFDNHQGRNVSREFGTRFDPVKADESDQVGTYCTKAGYELAMADAKIGRSEGHRHPFAIAHDAARWGDKADVMLLREWIVSSKRKRSIQWAGNDVKAYAKGEADKTDQELAAEEQIGDESLLVVERDVWRLLIRSTHTARVDFLQLFEDGGDTFDALYFLAELGITAEVAEDGPLAMLRLNTNHPSNNPNLEVHQQ
jgi:hypothetical protein